MLKKYKLLAAAVCGMAALAAHAQSSCTSDLFLAQSTAMDVNSTLNLINTTVNPPAFTPLGSASVPYNALGLHPGGDLYAMETGNGGSRRLFTINKSTGASTLVGSITGLPVERYTTGTFNEAGSYFIKPGGDNKTMYVVDVTALTFKTITLSQSIQVSDWGFVNGTLYSVTDDGQLVSINPTTGAVTK